MTAPRSGATNGSFCALRRVRSARFTGGDVAARHPYQSNQGTPKPWERPDLKGPLVSHPQHVTVRGIVEFPTASSSPPRCGWDSRGPLTNEKKKLKVVTVHQV